MGGGYASAHFCKSFIHPLSLTNMTYSLTEDLKPLISKPKVGVTYRVSWPNFPNLKGVCTAVDEERQIVVLKNPRSHAIWATPVKWSDLRLSLKELSK